jgi:hypothetical protein
MANALFTLWKLHHHFRRLSHTLEAEEVRGDRSKREIWGLSMKWCEVLSGMRGAQVA